MAGLGCLPQPVRLDGAGAGGAHGHRGAGGGWCLVAVPTHCSRLEREEAVKPRPEGSWALAVGGTRGAGSCGATAGRPRAPPQVRCLEKHDWRARGFDRHQLLSRGIYFVLCDLAEH